MPLLVCLDPGHGGYDPGACANDIQEKDVNLYAAQHLRDLLEHAGINVIMTRDSDVCPAGDTSNVTKDLQARCDISDNAGVDYFISIHFNAGGGVGSESYCIPGGQANEVAPSLVDATAAIFGYHGEKVKDGGPNGANLYVLKHTNAHAILLEIAYLDSSDAQKIKDHIAEVAPKLAIPLIKMLGGNVNVDAPVPVAPTTVISSSNSVVDMSEYVTKKELTDAITAIQKQIEVKMDADIATGITAGIAQKMAKIQSDLV